MDFLVNSECKEYDPFAYISLGLIVFILGLAKTIVVDKHKDKIICINDAIIQGAVGSGVGCFILYMFGMPEGFIAGVGVGTVSGVLFIDKWTKDYRPENITKIEMDTVVVQNPSKEIPNERRARFDKIDKDNYDMLDILYAYGYISEVQYKKVIECSIFESIDEMVRKLEEMPIITKSDIKEARVIMNLIRLCDKEVTRERAIRYIIEHGHKTDETGRGLDHEEG